jgi:hypothetical protein
MDPTTAPARLTATDVRRLTFFKWRYSLESKGFTADEAKHLLFQKWLAACGGYDRDLPPAYR